MAVSETGRSPLTTLSQVSALVTSDGRLLGPVYEQYRFVVPLSAISLHLIQAVVAIEDRRFFTHRGIDWHAILRAIVANVRKRRLAEGASTISQQVARTVVLGRRERTFQRKIVEMIVARDLERQFTKLQILEAYLNSSYFGHGLYGVEAASLVFFGKSAAETNEQEAAYLAGLLRSPARYCRCCHSRSARERTAFVLRRIGARAHFGSTTQRHPRPDLFARFPLTGGYVRQSLRDRLREAVPERYPSRRLVVKTTIDSYCQRIVEFTCRGAYQTGYRGRLACIVQEARSGAIRALSGGIDYRRQQFNAATAGRLQPGSVLKPFVLVAALQHGFTLETRFESRPLTVHLPDGADWTVRNNRDRYHGKISIADALVLSDNTVYAQLFLELGAARVQEVLESVGLRLEVLTPALTTGATRPGLSPLQVCAAYSIFSCDGVFVPPTFVAEIRDEDGAVSCCSTETRRVCDPAVSRAVSSVLRRVTRDGTGWLPHRFVGLASKTGSSASGGWYASYDESFRVLTWTDSDFLEVPSTPYAAKGVSAKMLADRIWSLLRAPGQVFSTLFGAFGPVDYLNVRDLLWLEREFQTP